MTKPIPFTQAQIRRAIAAAKKAGLQVVGIRPDGTIIVCDGKLQTEEVLRAVFRDSVYVPGNAWDSVLELDEVDTPKNIQPAAHALVKTQIPTSGEAWEEHLKNWREWVRQRPLGVLEKNALAGLITIKGLTPSRIKGAGPDTMERLEAREFVRQVEGAQSGRFPMYEITPDGEAEWRRISDAAA